MPELVAALIAELAGVRCRCGRVKRPGQTFCRPCFYILPRQLRGRLYRRVGDGYEETYTAALRILAGAGLCELPE